MAPQDVGAHLQDAPLQQQFALPIGSASDETTLVSALRRSKTLGITPCQALEDLDGVNNHGAAVWKDYFLDHLERLCALSGLQGSTVSTSNDHPLVPEANYRGGGNTEATFQQPQDSEIVAPILRRSARFKTTSGTMVSLSSTHSQSSQELLPTCTSEVIARRGRGKRVPVVHAGTRIPPQRQISKPQPPSRGELMVGGSFERYKFTDADKIFFIRYLEWRMRDADPIPTKSKLCDELAEYVPYHSARSWMKHWSKHPQRADEILAGHSRANILDGSSDDSMTHDSHTDEDGEAEYRPTGGGSASGALAVVPVKKGPWRTRKMTMQKQAVTDADLRAMARYRFEMYTSWPASVTRKERWRGFAEQKENAAKRSLLAWMAIEVTHGDRQLFQWLSS
ncbi:hypothetical protein GY45DRAFT_1330991 [Cubamyces sp. BRFM 1775]|nr:hypothetical protein GY45DRAFT_1330991 [Cubamyces sp. BRFM 1775]